MPQAADTPGREDITGLILAGGRGSRLGGEDKGLICLGRRPLASHVLERLTPQVSAVLISANRNRERYELLCPQVLPDDGAAFAGSLAGVLSGLRAARTPWLAVVPCDAPFLPSNLVQRLAAGVRGEVPVVAAGAQGPEPVFALVPVSFAARLADWLADGKRKVQDFYRDCGGTTVHFDDAETFVNVNTLGDLTAAHTRLPGG